MSPRGSELTVDPRVMRSRTRTLQATVDLLRERGIAGTTMEAVAERSGVAKTTIYRQWPSQPALVQDAFASLVNIPATPDTGSLEGDLRQLLSGLVRAVTASPAAALMPALIDAAQRDEAFALLHRSEAETRHRPLLLVVQRAIDRGELAPGTSARDVLDLVAGPVFYRRWVSGTDVDLNFVDTLLRAVVQVFGATDARST